MPFRIKKKQNKTGLLLQESVELGFQLAVYVLVKFLG